MLAGVLSLFFKKKKLYTGLFLFSLGEERRQPSWMNGWMGGWLIGLVLNRLMHWRNRERELWLILLSSRIA